MNHIHKILNIGGKCWAHGGEVEKKRYDNNFVRLRLQESMTPRKCIPLSLGLCHLPKLGQNASKCVDFCVCVHFAISLSLERKSYIFNL